MGALIPKEDVGVKTSALIPSSDPTPVQPNQEYMKSLVKKAALANENLGGDYQESVIKYTGLSSSGTAALVRDDVAEQEKRQRVLENVKRVNDSIKELTVSDVADNLASIAFQEKKAAALENEYIANLEKRKPDAWKDLADQNKDIFQRKAKEYEILNKINAIREEFAKEEDKEGIFQETIDFFKEVTAIPNILDFLNPVEGVLSTQVEDLKRLRGIIENLPEEQQTEALKTFKERLKDAPIINNPQDSIDLIDRMSFQPDSVEFETDLQALNFLFLGGALAIGKKAVKGGIKLAKGSKPFVPSPRGVTGDVDLETLTARAVSGEQSVADDIVNNEFKMTSKEQLDNQTSMLSSPASAYDESLSPYIQKAIDRNSGELSTVVEEFAAPERLARIAKDALSDFESNYIGRSVIGSNIDELTGNISYSFGTKRTKPFKTEATARKAIKDMQLEDAKGIQSVVPRETPHGWVVDVVGDSPDALKSWKELGFFGKFFKNMEDVVPGVISVARQAEDFEGSIVKTIEGVIDKDLRKFFGRKGKRFRAVIEDMQSEKFPVIDPKTGIDTGKTSPRWLTPSEFAVKYKQKFQRAPSQDEVKAYLTFRQLNDFAYELKLKTLTEGALLRKDRMFSIEKLGEESTYEVLGHKINSNTILGKSTNNKAIMTFGDSPRYFAKGKMSESIVKTLDDFDIINIAHAHRDDLYKLGQAEAPVKYVAIPKSTASREIVSTDLAKYLPGGRVVNESPFFIKVGRIVEDSAGDSTRLGDSTLFSASSRKHALEGAKKLNSFVKLMKENVDDLSKLTDDAIKALDLEAVGISTVREANKFMLRHKLYSSNFKIQGIADRELVDMGELGVSRSVARDAVSNNTRSQIFGERSEGVQNILGVESTVADPITATIHSLNITSEFASTTALRERALAYFAREFKKDLVTDSKNPYELLTAKVNEAVPLGKKNAIIAHQKFLTNMLGFKTDDEAAWSLFVEKIFNKVFDTKDGFFGQGGLSAKALRDKLESRQNLIDKFGKDPFTKIRGLTFHSTLGMMSLPSFIMQAINVSNIMLVSPKFGAKAASQALPVRMALLAKDPAVIDRIASHATKIGFESAEDFKQIIKEIRLSGIDNIGTNHSLIAGLNGLQLHGSVRRRAGQLSKVFFDQGELLNRITARLTAHSEFKARSPKIKVDSSEGRGWIGNRTHQLTLGMSRADNQLGLRNNFASIPLQFWSYPMRMTSALLPESIKGVKLGGTSAFTKAEKTRLAIGNILLWGGAGYPLLNILTDNFVQNNKLDPVTAKFIANGAFDTALYAMSGGKLDGNMSDRVGNAEFYQQIWEGLVGDKEAIEVLSGAAGSRANQAIGALSEPMRILKAGMAGDSASATDSGMRLLAGISSGANNWFKLYLSLKYGQIFSRNGKAMAGITKPEAFAQALGIPPQAYARLGEEFHRRRDRKELVKEYESLYIRAIRNIDEAGDEEALDAAILAIQHVGMIASEEGTDIQAEALSNALRSTTGKTMTDSMLQNYYRDKLSGRKVNENMAREAERQQNIEELQ